MSILSDGTQGKLDKSFRSMSLSVVERAPQRSCRRPETAPHVPVSLTTDNIDSAQPRQRSSGFCGGSRTFNFLLRSVDAEERMERTQRAEERHRLYERKVAAPQSALVPQHGIALIAGHCVDEESAPQHFQHFANSTAGIEDATSKSGTHYFSTFHQPHACRVGLNAKPPRPPRNPLEPAYTLAATSDTRPISAPVSTAVPRSRRGDGQFKDKEHRNILLTAVDSGLHAAAKKESIGVAKAAAAAAAVMIPSAEVFQRHDTLQVRDVNGHKLEATTLRPKENPSRAQQYIDYSDVARSTNRWYLEQQEKKAQSKVSLGLLTSDINCKSREWMGKTIVDPQSGEAHAFHRETNPLTPRYRVEKADYGAFEKHVRPFSPGRSSTHRPDFFRCGDIDGAKSGLHGMPMTLELFRAKYPAVSSRVVAAVAQPRRERVLSRSFEDSDIFGTRVCADAALDGQPQDCQAKYSMQGIHTEMQEEYLSPKMQKHSNITVAKRRHEVTAGHPHCTFAKVRPEGRSTNPVAPMYNYERSAESGAAAFTGGAGSAAWNPTTERLDEQPTAKSHFQRSDDHCGFLEQQKQLLSQKRTIELNSRVSKAKQLKDEIELVRSLPK